MLFLLIFGGPSGSLRWFPISLGLFYFILHRLSKPAVSFCHVASLFTRTPWDSLKRPKISTDSKSCDMSDDPCLHLVADTHYSPQVYSQIWSLWFLTNRLKLETINTCDIWDPQAERHFFKNGYHEILMFLSILLLIKSKSNGQILLTKWTESWANTYSIHIVTLTWKTEITDPNLWSTIQMDSLHIPTRCFTTEKTAGSLSVNLKSKGGRVMQVSEAAKLWLEYHKSHYKENSIRAYKLVLTEFCGEFGGPRTWRK